MRGGILILSRRELIAAPRHPPEILAGREIGGRRPFQQTTLSPLGRHPVSRVHGLPCAA
jgi:hypothetical protein